MHSLHPILSLLKTSCKLATAQGIKKNYGKIETALIPPRTMKQNKFQIKPFEQIIRITDIIHKITGVPLIAKFKPKINFLETKIQIKDKYTEAINTFLTVLQRLNKITPFFSKFYPIYNQKRKPWPN